MSRFADIKTEVDQIPVTAIVRSAGINLTTKASYSLCRCPFHHDSNPSMMVKDSFFSCYGCGEKGDGISFVQRFYGLEFKEAVYKIALDHGILTVDDYEAITNNNHRTVTIHKAPVQIKIKDTKLPPKASPEVLDMVYSSVVEMCGLSEEHLKHLHEERSLSDEQIKDNYFTITENKFLDLSSCLQEKISKRTFHKPYSMCSYEEQQSVQQSLNGMLEDVKKGLVPGVVKYGDGFKLSSISSGLGLVCRDSEYRISGIQIRSFGEGARYTWLSNAYCHGASAGTPSGVIYPYAPSKNPCVCITEGRFKAEKIAECGNIAIYVSGVSTWKNALPLVEDVVGSRETIFLMFDADLMGNPSVHTNLKNLAQELKSYDLTPMLVLWKKEYGKGFDDLLVQKKEKYASFLKYMSFERFEGIYEKWYAYLLKHYKVESFQKLSDADVPNFKGNLQYLIEKMI